MRENIVEDDSRFWPGVWATLRWLSAVTAGLSLFYLTRSLLHLGLGPVMSVAYQWYAAATHPIVEPLKPVVLHLMQYFHLSLPSWWPDVVVAYVTLGGAMAKALIRSDAEFARRVDLDRFSLRLGQVTQLGAVLLWPLDLSANLVVSIMTGSYKFWRTWMSEISKVVVAIVIFTAINAFL